MEAIFRTRMSTLPKDGSAVYMLIPKWEQTPYGYGESPNAKFFVSLPLSIRGLPIWLRGLCFWHPFSHSLKNIFFAEASQFSYAHRANIPYHHHTSIAITVAFATATVVSCLMAGCCIDASASHPLDSASASKRLTSAY